MGWEIILILVGIGLVLAFVEIIVPGGVMGGIGAVLIIVGLVAAFTKDFEYAAFLFLGTVVIAGAGLYTMLRWGVNSRFGKGLILQQSGEDWHSYDEKCADLLDKEGEAHTSLRPAGIAKIEGGRYDVVTRGEMVQAGQKVRVVKVSGNNIVVKPVAPEERDEG